MITIVPSQFTSLQYRLTRKAHGDPPPKHVSFYNRSTLTKFLEESDFTKIKVRYNLELYRVLRLLGSRPKQNQKDGRNSGFDPSSSDYGPMVAAAKALVNRGANIFGIGDELLAMAEKPIAV